MEKRSDTLSKLVSIFENRLIGKTVGFGPTNRGSNPRSRSNKFTFPSGRLVRRQAVNLCNVGSNPTLGAQLIKWIL